MTSRDHRPGIGGRSRTAICAVIALVGGCAMPSEPYVGVQALATVPTNTDQDSVEARNAVSPGVGLVAGARLRPWLRAEAELDWRIDQIHGYGEESADGDVHTVPLLVNVWLHPPSGRLSWLYAGGGGGAAWQRIDGSHGSSTGEATKSSGLDTAWQVGGGVRAPLGERVSADLGYRYLETGVASQHAALLGLIWRLSE